MYLLKRRRGDEPAVPPTTAPPAQTPGRRADAGMQVLAFLAEQGLDPTPTNYELGYLNRFDADSTVARSIDAILMAGNRVTQADADRIMLTHALHRAKQLQQANSSGERDAMRLQTLRLADIAAAATEATGRFGRDIGDTLTAVEDSGVRGIVSAMLDHTSRTERELLAASQQIEQLRQDVEAARLDALRDGLTGLLNRRGAEAEFELLRAGAGQVTIAMCDVDHFKSINDRFGHPVGDRVLKAVASELAERGSPFLVARWGGEEFAIIMDGVDVARGGEIVEDARAAVARKTFRLRETDEPLGAVTLSAGIVACDDHDFEAAIRRADDALYAAKAAGRNCQVTR